MVYFKILDKNLKRKLPQNCLFDELKLSLKNNLSYILVYHVTFWDLNNNLIFGGHTICEVQALCVNGQPRLGLGHGQLLCLQFPTAKFNKLSRIVSDDTQVYSVSVKTFEWQMYMATWGGETLMLCGSDWCMLLTNFYFACNNCCC